MVNKLTVEQAIATARAIRHELQRNREGDSLCERMLNEDVMEFLINYVEENEKRAIAVQ